MKRSAMRVLSPEEQAREDAEGRLAELSRELGVQELEVLCRLGCRLLEGQHVYGLLDLANDRRDLEAERADELADALTYSAMLELRRVLRRRRETSVGALRKLARGKHRKGRRS